jgi:pSer/pThr/pTyr-binding forkhead associated (FHA) protein
MKSLTFGRGPGVDVALTGDEYMSPVHCRITERDGRYYVEDCGSTNGTWIVRQALGGLPMRVYGPTLLIAGEKVRIGRTILPWKAER